MRLGIGFWCSMTTSSDSYPTVESYGIPKIVGWFWPPQPSYSSSPKVGQITAPNLQRAIMRHTFGVHLRHQKDLTPTPKSMLRTSIIRSAPRSALPTGAPKPDLTPPPHKSEFSVNASAPQTRRDKTKKLLCLQPSNQKPP